MTIKNISNVFKTWGQHFEMIANVFESHRSSKENTISRVVPRRILNEQYDRCFCTELPVRSLLRDRNVGNTINATGIASGNENLINHNSMLRDRKIEHKCDQESSILLSRTGSSLDVSEEEMLSTKFCSGLGHNL